MMRAVFKYLKSHPVKESTNLFFVTPEEKIRNSRQKSQMLVPAQFKKVIANDLSDSTKKRLFRQ